MYPLKVLVTGSSGFLGQRLVTQLREHGDSVREVVRNNFSDDKSVYHINSINGNTDWSSAFTGVDCIVHCAARVHQMEESEACALEAYRDINTRGTVHLAKQAAKAGVKRFVFVSSVKVNGEQSKPNTPFLPNYELIPQDAYGLSKYEAEMQLKQLSIETDLEIVIVRPPLVYGPGVKENFLSMMRWVKKGIPLPLGAIHNKRSLVYIDNLVNLLVTCCSHPNAVGETFMVSDDQDISTTQLLKLITAEMERQCVLIPVPMKIINFVTMVLRKPYLYPKICGNLQVDISKTKMVLGWSPPVPLKQGVNQTVRAYLDLK